MHLPPGFRAPGRNCKTRTEAICTDDPIMAKGAAAVTASLRVLATSDLHMHIAPHDYFSDQPCTRYGLALVAGLLTRARQNHPNTLLLDNGDFLQGSPLGDFVQENRITPHPMIAAMNSLGYDAANIGNHEFSGGMAPLAAALEAARFPCISANSLDAASMAPLFATHALLDRRLKADDGSEQPIRIGVIGVLPPQTVIWDAQVLNGRVCMTDMVESVARLLPALRRNGADLVIVLAHCGIGTAPSLPLAESAGLAIAALPGVDALVMGHVHQPFPGPVAEKDAAIDPVAGTLFGKPAVMPGFFGSHLGVIDLDLHRSAAGWQVAGHRAQVTPVCTPGTKAGDAPCPDAGVLAVIDSVHRATRNWARRPVATCRRPFHSYFSLITDTLPQQVVNKAQAAYVRRRLAGTRHAGLPVLAATAPFRAGGRAGPENYSFVPKGPFRIRNAADLYMHPNTVMAFTITGNQLAAWLNQATRIFQTVAPGQQDAPLIDPSVPSFLFDTIHGITYQIDLSADWQGPGTHRIRDLRHEGRPVHPDDRFILATNSYRGSGSGGFAAGLKDQVCLADTRLNRDVVIDYLTENQNLPDPDPPNWSFAPMPGTTVLFETSPRALEHLDEVSHFRPEPLSITKAGFQQLRLWL